MTTLPGSVVLVVGATGGLGREIARQLSAAGATLVLAGRDTARLAALGIPGTLVTGDLTDVSAVDALVARAVQATGGLDGVVNAAGVVAFGPARELGDAAMEELFAVNTLAPIRLLRAAADSLTASAAAGREPFFVTLSGVVSESPTAGLAAYSASKAALAAFGQATGRELRRSGIRMIDARPGHTETGLADHPISGVAPNFPAGLQPEAVAARIVGAIAAGERDLPSSAFAPPA
ncbi:SDR family NAD(P)-dependent oxidoreductase [Cryobacterium sp. MDB2-33-2]|uniref:SDR family NAD(P)-dependent oxidoreductase n=1 Tax=Cryobacterium sp. MDB2-33-2 TaxID=1259179 RepID=UPI00106A0566|nr:SDR family NAD(P)-dependent oxidoreductase [Cryobacterium sp. MDB2-33-2]TFC10212.1 SDR family NAD(P)-dependent oxidoreductase [Cryobacterium sp. MDB2-33-2]